MPIALVTGEGQLWKCFRGQNTESRHMSCCIDIRGRDATHDFKTIHILSLTSGKKPLPSKDLLPGINLGSLLVD